MAGPKRIFVHIGAPKTGSSALQAYLSANAEGLEKLGFSYPFPESKATVEAGVCSGNLLHVMQRRATENGLQADITGLSEAFLQPVIDQFIKSAKSEKIIISGEFLTQGANRQIISVLEDVASHHDVTVIAYVRDVYYHVISGWKQVVKSRSQEYDIYQYVERRLESGELSLQRLSGYLASGLPMEVRNYDLHRDDLVGSFLEVIGIDRRMSGLSDLQYPEKNRSLSFWQAKMAVLAQRSVGSSLLNATMLGRFRNQVDKRPDPYFPDLDKRLLAALAELVRDVNERLPPGEKLRDSALGHVASTDQFCDADLEVLLGAVKDVLAQTRQTTSVSSQLPGLPPGFDPREYLLRNPDVAAAGMDPAYHYLNHGRFEGRPIGTVRADDV